MRKRVEVFAIILLLLIISISCIGFVSSVAGVSPAIYRDDYYDGFKKDYSFNFYFNDDSKAEIYAEGDLSQYVKLNKKSISGSEGVRVSVSLPIGVVKPGKNIIYIGAREIIDPEGGVGLAGNIRGVIVIKVPYPGKYVESELKVSNANPGELIDLELNVDNLGQDDVTASVIVETFNSKGLKEKLELGSKLIPTKEEEVFKKRIDSNGYGSGDYYANATIYYGGDNPSYASSIFRIGRLYVGIGNITSDFEKGKINRFIIPVESFWNDDIEGLHANVSFPGYDESFLTPTIKIEPWEKTQLTGFFDASKIDKDEFQANITLYYEGGFTNKLVDVNFKKEVNYTMYIIIGVLSLVIVVLAGVIIILIKNGKKK